MIRPLLPFDIPPKRAAPEHEARVERLLDALAMDPEDPAWPLGPLDDVERAHARSLETCHDGLSCVLEHESLEEPVFYLPGVLRPLWVVLSCAPLAGRDGAPSARDLARAVLQTAALLGGDARLGVLGLVSGEEAVGRHYSEVYPRALARLASLVRWAVAALEAQGEGFVPAHLVESAPLLAAARFERARRVYWPSLRSAWSLTSGLPAALRGTAEAWTAVDARLAALTDAIAAVETGPPPRPGAERPAPGTLVFVPCKGVSVVLEHAHGHDVVAHWSRPTRPDTWYPPASLASLTIAPPPFAGQVPFPERHRAGRDLARRLHEIRARGGAATSFVRLHRQILGASSGLERETGRAYVDEDVSQVDPDPTAARVQTTQAAWALAAHLQDLCVLCDPILGRVALDRARRLIAHALNGDLDGFYLRLAHCVRATAAWVAADEAEAAADALAAAALAHPDEPDTGTLVGLASVGRWRAIEALLATDAWQRVRARWEAEADEWDFSKDAHRARSALRIVQLVERLAADGGVDGGTAADVRALLADEHMNGLTFDTVLWLRVLHGWRGWTARPIALSSYFELPPYRLGSGDTPLDRVPPEALADEVATLRALAGTDLVAELLDGTDRSMTPRLRALALRGLLFAPPRDLGARIADPRVFERFGAAVVRCIAQVAADTRPARTPTGDALIEAVLAAPDDPSVRGVLADWCAERDVDPVVATAAHEVRRRLGSPLGELHRALATQPELVAEALAAFG